tara:strand:- start:398 stop:1306 length:909 start_codon:yes stop_codon:yes gene_type:complete
VTEISNNFWWRFELEVSYLLEETLIWKMERLGINSFALEFFPEKSEVLNLTIWLPSNELNLQEREGFFSKLSPLAETFGITLQDHKWSKIVDEDWTSMWKKYWKPDPVGKDILILPAWIDMPIEASNRKIVRIDPGTAFGTGSHPTTRLCLEALDRDPPKGEVVADLGCGSGILGLTALSFGAKKVFSVDQDSLAVHSTKHNFQLNNFEKDSLVICHGSLDILLSALRKDRVDLLLCNILAPIIKLLAPGFDQVLSPKGKALLSGVLVNQVDELSSCLNNLGWNVSNSWEQSDWTLLEITRD